MNLFKAILPLSSCLSLLLVCSAVQASSFLDEADEWDETRWKAESLLKILRTYIKNIDPDPNFSDPAYSPGMKQ